MKFLVVLAAVIGKSKQYSTKQNAFYEYTDHVLKCETLIINQRFSGEPCGGRFQLRSGEGRQSRLCSHRSDPKEGTVHVQEIRHRQQSEVPE